MPKDTNHPAMGDAAAGTERVLRVLDQIANAARPPTHSELAASLGIAKSTLTRILSAMRQLEYVDLANRRYAPGPQMLMNAHNLAPRALRDVRLRGVLRPILQSLAAQTGETAALSVEIGGNRETPGLVLAIDHVESANPVRYVPTLGRPLHMYRGAAGRVFLAFSHRMLSMLPSERRTWQGGDLSGDPVVAAAELEEVRQRGCAINLEAADGVIMLSAPVLDHTGWPVAAISLFGPTFRMKAWDVHWPALRRAAAEASDEVGRISS